MRRETRYTFRLDGDTGTPFIEGETLIDYANRMLRGVGDNGKIVEVSAHIDIENFTIKNARGACSEMTNIGAQTVEVVVDG